MSSYKETLLWLWNVEQLGIFFMSEYCSVAFLIASFTKEASSSVVGVEIVPSEFQSLMLDWEFSPSSSFEQDENPPGLRGQCFEDICLHPLCVVLRRKYKELINSISSSGFQPSVHRLT
jgi:hypothetical protein